MHYLYITSNTASTNLIFAMNKLFFSCCALTLSLCLSAQTMIKEMDGANTRFIPGIYMKNGEAAIYFSSDEYGYEDGQAQIFDFELKPLKSFYFQTLNPYTVTEQRASSGTKELTKVIPQVRDEIVGLSDISDMEARKNDFINWFFNENKYLDHTLTMDILTSGCRIQGSTIYITLPIKKDSGYYYPYAEYLKAIEVFFDESDKFGYNYTYTAEVPIYNGEWATSTWYDVPVRNFCTPKCTDVAKMNHWNGGVYLPFSQTFFNEDEKFEYVRYIADIVEGYGSYDNMNPVNPLQILFGITDNDRDGDGVEDYRSTHFGIKYTGLEVVSEDGTIIYSFPLPETCEANPSIEFFKSDNSILAQVDFNWRDDNGSNMHTVRFYRLDKSAGMANIIREENRMSASPNPVSAGVPIRMKIPAGNNGDRIVSVTSLNGVQIYSNRIEATKTDISIPTHGLQPGMYLFTLSENGNIIGNCKIIVR